MEKVNTHTPPLSLMYRSSSSHSLQAQRHLIYVVAREVEYKKTAEQTSKQAGKQAIQHNEKKKRTK